MADNINTSENLAEKKGSLSGPPSLKAWSESATVTNFERGKKEKKLWRRIGKKESVSQYCMSCMVRESGKYTIEDTPEGRGQKVCVFLMDTI